MSPHRAELVGAKNGHDEVFNFSPWRPPSLLYYILYYWSVRLAIGNSPAKLIYCPVLIPFKICTSGWAFKFMQSEKTKKFEKKSSIYF